MLEGFEKYTVTAGIAALSITENGITFSKTAVTKMGKCDYVNLLIDYNGKRIAIQSAESDDSDATKFYTGNKNTSVRWNNKELIKTICQLMDWSVKNKEVYKVEGIYIKEEKAMIFDLKNGKLMKKGDLDEE